MSFPPDSFDLQTAIRSLRLYVNGMEVFRDLPFGLWLGTNRYYIAPAPSLRDHSLWRSYIVPPPPQLILAAELTNRIEAIVGDYINDYSISGLSWPSDWYPWPNRRAIQVSGSGSRTVRVNLHLSYSRLGYGQTVFYDVDVWFDLEFSCSGGKLYLMTRNLGMNYPLVDGEAAINKVSLQLLLQPVLSSKIQSSLQTVTYKNNLGQAACPAISVASDGSVSLSY